MVCCPNGTTVHYATSANNWMTEVLWNGEAQGCTLALDGNGEPTIAFVALEPNAVLRYATRSGEGNWTSEGVSTAASATYYSPSLALGTRGIPAIAMISRPVLDYQAVLVALDNGVWRSTSLNENATLIAPAFDPDGIAHVAVLDPGNETRHGTRNPNWSFEDIGVAQRGLSFAVDRDGGLHATYGNGNQLLYTTNARGAWAQEVVDDSLYFVAPVAAGPTTLHVVGGDSVGDNLWEIHHWVRALPDGVDDDCDGNAW